MSDDEDFYDDEFDEDYVWFEDASPDAAVSISPPDFHLVFCDRAPLTVFGGCINTNFWLCE